MLARSASKATAAAEILRAEHAELGDQLRALVLTDFAEAGATISATLAGALGEGAGGALRTLRSLLRRGMGRPGRGLRHRRASQGHGRL